MYERNKKCSYKIANISLLNINNNIIEPKVYEIKAISFYYNNKEH